MFIQTLATLGLLMGGSLIIALILVPLFRALALRHGLVDRPDARRKTHTKPIPVSGGLAVLTATILTLFLAWLIPNPLSEPLASWAPRLIGLLLGSVVICTLGALDDARPLRGRHKLLGQVVAVLCVIPYDAPITAVQLMGWRFDLGWLAVPFILFCLLGAINSMNLLDGMDGLLGSLSSVIGLALVALAALRGDWAAACVAAAIVGAVFGFLRYNYPPAKVYLGDAGSMFLGLILGSLALQGRVESRETVQLVIPLSLFSLPIFDTLAAILRRKLTGRSIYCTDRGHLHHCLLRCGLSKPRVLLVVVTMAVITTSGAVAGVALHRDVPALAAALAGAGVLITARMFGHAEAMLLLRRVQRLARTLVGKTPAAGHQLEVRLQGSADWTRLWAQLIERAQTLNLKFVLLDVNAPAIHESYHASWQGPPRPESDEQANTWSAAIPLSVRGQAVGRLDVTGWRDSEPMWSKVAAMTYFADQVEAQLHRLTASNEPAAAPAPVLEVGPVEERLGVSVATVE